MDERLRQGLAFIREQRWDEAVAVLEEARRGGPEEPDVLFALAQAHYGRWRETGRPTDWERSVILARRCLEIDPERDAVVALLRTIHLGMRQRPRTPRVLLAGWAAFVFLIILGFGLALISMPQRAHHCGGHYVYPAPAVTQ